MRGKARGPGPQLSTRPSRDPGWLPRIRDDGKYRIVVQERGGDRPLWVQFANSEADARKLRKKVEADREDRMRNGRRRIIKRVGDESKFQDSTSPYPRQREPGDQ